MWDALIVNPLINILLGIYTFTGHNFGIAIILFTLFIRLVTHPLMVQQMKGAQAMQEFQKSKEWQDTQKKYKDDREKLAQEQMRLYKEMGINPLGSCLPSLIQLPIMLAFYQAIVRALAVTPIQLLEFARHIYPFFNNIAGLIPLKRDFLWMDLSQPERVYGFGVGIPVLAILVVITTYFQSKMMTPPSAGGPGDQSAQMTKMMNLYMPFFMGYIAYTLASGLAIYFVASNLISIAQYAALGKLNWRNLLPQKKTAQPEITPEPRQPEIKRIAPKKPRRAARK